MKVYREVRVLDEGRLFISQPYPLYPGERGNHLTGGWVGPIAGPEDWENRKFSFSFRKSNL